MVDDVTLREAAKCGDVQHVKTQLRLGADVNSADKDGKTALHLAAEQGHVLVAEELLARGADINRLDDDGRTALICAAEEGHGTMAKTLTARGAEVNCTDSIFNTALIWAAKHGNAAIGEALLASGANTNTTNFAQEAALHAASREGHLAMVKVLLERGADVSLKNEDGDTPLHMAAQRGQTLIVKALLASGADVHSINNAGNTPLHESTQTTEPDVALVLWHAGADPMTKNKQGKTPLSLLPQDNEAAKQMCTSLRSRSAPSSPGAEIRDILSFLASRPFCGEQTFTAQDAIPELKHVLQGQLSRSGAQVTVDQDAVEDVVAEQMDPNTGLLEVGAVIKSFYDLQSKYPTLRREKEPPELRARFRIATRSKKMLKVKLAKRLLLGLFEASGSEAGCSQPTVSFKRSNSGWNESVVDVLLGEQKRDENVIDEEGFVKVGMKVLFA